MSTREIQGHLEDRNPPLTRRERTPSVRLAALQAKPENPFNYIQALGEAKDRASIEVLQTYFAEFRAGAETEKLGRALLES
jgi:hypothetical protein